MNRLKIINLTLFVLFSILIAVSLYLVYSNTGKKYNSKQDQNEVAIHVLSFDELPRNEQEKYVKKDNLDTYGKFLTPKSYEKNLKISSINEPIPSDLEELKRQVSDLRVQNKILYDDNIDLVSKNLEIANLLSSKDASLSYKNINLRMIMDSEKYLETINDLTKKLEESQNENLQSSKISSQKIVKLQNEIDSLRNEMVNRLNQFERDKAQLISKNSDEMSKNLKTQMDEKLRLEKELLKITGELSKIKDENARMTDSLSLKEFEFKRVETEQKDKVLKIQAASQDMINTLNKEFEVKKNEYEKDIKSKLNEIEALKREQNLLKESLDLKSKELEKKLAELNLINEKNDKFISLNKEQNATIENLKSRLQIERSGFEKEVTGMWSLHKKEVEKLKKQLNELSSNLQNTKDELEKEITKLKEQNLKKDEQIIQSESNITSLNAMLATQKERLESEIFANKKNIQNYKILNDKITSLIQGNAIISKEAKKRVDNAEIAVEIHKKTIDELNSTLALKDKEISEINLRLEKIKNSLEIQTKKNETLTQSLKNNQNPLSLEVSELKTKISQLMQESEYLSSENDNLKKIIQLNFKAEVPKKVVFIESIECDDMVIGSDKPTVICKNRVSEFVQRYNSNYFFEITPIVSHGNFIATSKVAQLIPKNELEKINLYANFGIGRERAKTAGELIKDEFGDFSRISYSNEIITSDNKQGFVIKVYR
ncbi:vesicular transport factor Uso1p [Campylobacter sp. RM16187]|uniref:vesicular transport factor Uso1p n=1 Tax=Campylobacter sp. RM16187 TaxID=1660063 RepID=UPI0021B651E5|nr:vesicular transport factor Uso1p [Campylobacter sp. RM16187]QKG29425.1 putative chromosome segregation protein [Campylobacter sp. RM16187]